MTPTPPGHARSATRRPRHRMIGARGAAALLCAIAALPARAAPGWADRIAADCPRIEARHGVEIGVHVRDLDSGEAASCRATQSWYLASTVKVPVAIAVLRGVEAGRYTLDTLLTVRAADLVDGGPLAATRPVGATLPLRELLEQMIVHSDNTASDMLIALVGVANVNALVRELVPSGIGRITSLGDVRRAIYARLVPEGAGLDGEQLLMLQRARTDDARLALLAQLTGTPLARSGAASYAVALDGYYASGVNSGRLDAYGDLLAALATGRALGAEQTGWLLDLMARIETGSRRIVAGLPHDVRFAHKTGTQRGRLCDAGLLTVPRAAGDRRLLVVACTRGHRSLDRGEAALRHVGAALCRSGVLARGRGDGAACPEEPEAMPVRDAPPRR